MDYQRLFSKVPIGKRLRSAHYLHLDSLESCSQPLGDFIEGIRKRISLPPIYNVLKLHLNGPKISFLYYPDFFDNPHPELKSSFVVDLLTGSVHTRYYESASNPPILHRKETLLAPDHPRRQEFERLTQQEEREGLYDSRKVIGFKKRWEALLASKGLAYEGHTLIRTTSLVEEKPEPKVQVHRHKTALVRYNLSRPIQNIIQHGLLFETTTFLDYGCGQGDDVKRLKELGFNVSCWDPVYYPGEPREEADIVNLGFVLNVIEDPAERSIVLQSAYELSKKLLVVSAQVATSSNISGTPYRDGYLTRRNTFQKYFQQKELGGYIEAVLDVTAVPVGLGIFYVFRDPSDRQIFLANRYRRSLRAVDFTGIDILIRERKTKSRAPDLYEVNRELIDSFWSKMLQLGRLPLETEFERYQEICRILGSARKAERLFVRKFGEEPLLRAFEKRKDDLQVYLALSSFRRPPPFRDLPKDLQVDIKTFLGGYAKGIAESKSLLFSVGNPDVVAKICEETTVGYLDDQALFFHNSLLEELHPVLRVYVGCGEMLYGDLEGVDIIKIHKRSGKISLLKYDDFEGKSLPELRERIKINLRHLSTEVFDHRSPTPQLLYFKERYVAKDHPMREKWSKFTERLKSLGIDLGGYGPTKQELLSFLESKGLIHKLEEEEGRIE